jgi:hypothetical protein
MPLSYFVECGLEIVELAAGRVPYGTTAMPGQQVFEAGGGERVGVCRAPCAGTRPIAPTRPPSVAAICMFLA